MKKRKPHSEYRTTETTVYCCRYHVIFCPKYRRSVLRESIAERFKEVVLSMGNRNFWWKMPKLRISDSAIIGG